MQPHACLAYVHGVPTSYTGHRKAFCLSLTMATMDPVLSAWGASDEIMVRLSTKSGSILVLSGPLNRDAVVANGCLLGPLMKHVGPLPV